MVKNLSISEQSAIRITPEVYWSGLPLILSMYGSSYAMETEFSDLCIIHYTTL